MHIIFNENTQNSLFTHSYRDESVRHRIIILNGFSGANLIINRKQVNKLKKIMWISEKNERHPNN